MKPQTQLDTFIARFTPEIAALGKAALAKMRKRFPGAIQMVYDNYNGLVIGFSPTERPSQAIFSILFLPRYVCLCFLQKGPQIPDPEKLLRGSGNVARNIRLESAAMLDQPAVKALISHAMELADIPFDSKANGSLIIRSVSARQRPRRPK
ncbi:MAG: hypothetical protein JWR26_3028 [Pedosphaera sp.]|nr:hypothetical protein [Pedosphaera sp.]